MTESKPPRRARVRVSRQGFTRCTSCGRHIRLAASVAATRCPFCAASLAAAETPAGGLAWVAPLARGARGSLLAAGLLGALACDPSSSAGAAPDVAGDSASADDTGIPSDTATDDTVEPADDVGPQPEYGAPPDDVVVPPDEIGPQPLYGLPADVAQPPDDVPIAPLYGVPPPDISEPPADISEPPADTSESHPDVAETPDDVPVAPLYGSPPPADAGVADDVEPPTPDADPGPVPLYGLPPATPQ